LAWVVGEGWWALGEVVEGLDAFELTEVDE
jgi:hypothetical protein